MDPKEHLLGFKYLDVDFGILHKLLVNLLHFIYFIVILFKVRFTSKIYSIYNPPRSCTGTLTGDGIITCKPPKFAEIGIYIVSVSMDGTNSLPQTFEINIYKETVITQQYPEIIDIRKDEDIKSIKLVSYAIIINVIIILNRRLMHLCHLFHQKMEPLM